MALVADMRADAEAAALARYVAIRGEMDRIVAGSLADRISEDDLLTAHAVADSTSVDKGVLGTRASSKFTRDPLLNMGSEVSAMRTSLNAYLTHIGLSTLTW